MNMFKRGRKAKEQGDSYEGLPVANSPSHGFKTNKTTKRKGKNVVEEKPVFTLDTVLPQQDDFRTSLIMPGLSARFSMLREQNDPNTKIGKAADDSVLFPKRASRLNLFGHNQMALNDIAEVESIRSSFRPPFAERDRSNSFGDGYDSDSGSMMTRSRPGEGNNLFGGRQKLYRIPTASTRNLNESEPASMGGKHMYESDVSLSLFQQYKRREREAQRLEAESASHLHHDAYDSDAVHSPTLGNEFSQKRGTQSSTASAASNLRSSTAATSVASDSPHLHTGNLSSSRAENHSSPSPTFRKPKDELPKPARQLSQSKSAANIRERYRPAGIYSASALRGNAPASAGAVQPLDFGFGDLKQSIKASRQATSPSQGDNSDTNDVLANSVHANDRGKATALGLFNKPAKEFDEQQYLQRQLQMHEGRKSPFQSSSRSQSRTSSEAHRTQTSAIRATPSPAPSEITHTPQVPPIPAASNSPQRTVERIAQPSASTVTSPGRQPPSSRPRSKSSASATAKDNVKARVESLIRRQNAELAQLETENLGSGRVHESSPSQQGKNATRSTFLDDEEDDNDGNSTHESGYSAARQSAADSLRLPESDIHPAFRSSFATSTTSSQFSKPRSMVEDGKDDENSPNPFLNFDSDSLAPDNNLGLSGMIRSHLRHDSERSVALATALRNSSHIDSSVVQSSNSSRSHEINESLLSPGQIAADPPTPTTAMSQRAQMMLSQAQNLRAAAQEKASLLPDDDASDYGDDENQDQQFSSHQRGDSSATTKERREFDEELAKRRRKIREGLKSVVERDNSETPATSKGREYTLQAFAQPGDDFTVEAHHRVRPDRPIDSSVEPSSRASHERRQNASAKTSAEYPDKRSFSDESLRNGSTTPSQYPGPSPGYTTRDEAGSRSITPSSGKFGRSRSNSAAADRARNALAFRNQPSPPVPGPYSPTNLRSTDNHYQANGPQEGRGRSGSTVSGRPHVTSPTSPLSELNFNVSRPSPITSSSPFIDFNPSSSYQYSSGRTTTGSNSRSASQNGRKRSGTKTQISDPTFISSTSSVPLVPLPQTFGSQSPPPLPEMNPRRKGNTQGEKNFHMLNLNLSNALRSPLETVPASPRFPEHDIRSSLDDSSSARPKPKLRKSSSEGGNLASTARQQAILAEMHREKAISPGLPSRSATALGLSQEGGMF